MTGVQTCALPILLEAIENPKILYEGLYGEIIAIGKNIELTNKFIVAIYKEVDYKDGFIITAYISTKEQKFDKRKVLWEQ